MARRRGGHPIGTHGGRARFDGLILGGGRGRRLGGAAKAALELGGQTFGERARDALSAAGEVIFVGPAELAPAGVRGVRENPPGSGPGAAIAAGLPELSADVVVVLAVDHALVTHEVVDELVGGLGDADGCVLEDDEGREQPLAAAYRTEALRAALDRLDSMEDVSVREAIDPLRRHRIRHAAALDCDTPEDLRRLEKLVTATGLTDTG